jgi:hypothetical protein
MSQGSKDLSWPFLLAVGAVPVVTAVCGATYVLGEMTSQSKPSTITVASKDVVNGVTMLATSSDSAPAPRTYIIATSDLRLHYRRAVDAVRVIEPGCTYRVDAYRTGGLPFIPSRLWNIESAAHVPTPACPTNGARPARTPGR